MIVGLEKEVESLEARMEGKYNETHREIASTLQDIKDQVVAVRDNQQKMWRAIDNMGKERQELPQGGASIDEEDKVEWVPNEHKSR